MTWTRRTTTRYRPGVEPLYRRLDSVMHHGLQWLPQTEWQKENTQEWYRARWHLTIYSAFKHEAASNKNVSQWDFWQDVKRFTWNILSWLYWCQKWCKTHTSLPQYIEHKFSTFNEISIRMNERKNIIKRIVEVIHPFKTGLNTMVLPALSLLEAYCHLIKVKYVKNAIFGNNFEQFSHYSIV